MSETGNLLGEAASLDPAIRDRVINLANMALNEAEHLIKFGDPIMKSRLISSFMTTFAKHMRTQETDNELEELRKELHNLQVLVTQRVPGQDSTHEEGGELEVVQLPTDSPPMIHGR